MTGTKGDTREAGVVTVPTAVPSVRPMPSLIVSSPITRFWQLPEKRVERRALFF